MERGKGDDFRTLLRRYRDHKRWSQERLAFECEMDHSLVSRLESGQRAPTPAALTKLSAGLGLSTGDADDLWPAAGFLPPALPLEALREALVLVRTTLPGEVRGHAADRRGAAAGVVTIG